MPQIHWLTWKREEAFVMEPHNKTGRVNIVKDKLLGKNEYAVTNADSVLLCHLRARCHNVMQYV